MKKNNSIHQQQLFDNGFSVKENIYSEEEIQNILTIIDQTDSSNETFRKTNDLFAIRQFLREIPTVIDLIFTENLKSVMKEIIGEDFFVVKSIYFDKPETSNWYVPYHQDLTISVDKKMEIKNFELWTTKQNQFANHQ